MICGALTWFLASEKRRKEQLENQVNGKVEEEDEVGNNNFVFNVECFFCNSAIILQILGTSQTLAI